MSYEAINYVQISLNSKALNMQININIAINLLKIYQNMAFDFMYNCLSQLDLWTPGFNWLKDAITRYVMTFIKHPSFFSKSTRRFFFLWTKCLNVSSLYTCIYTCMNNHRQLNLDRLWHWTTHCKKYFRHIEPDIYTVYSNW